MKLFTSIYFMAFSLSATICFGQNNFNNQENNNFNNQENNNFNNQENNNFNNQENNNFNNQENNNFNNQENNLQQNNNVGDTFLNQEVPENGEGSMNGNNSQPLEPKKGPPIVKNMFSGVLPVPGTIRNMADGEAPDEYIVEPGDTLYDICDQLLDEGGYWPRLWSLNPFIKNPHFIWPGMKLVFYPGDDDIPPFMQVFDEGDLVPVDKGELVESELVKAEIPDLKSNYEPVTTEVVYSDRLGASDYDGSLVMSVGPLFDSNIKKVTVPGFIYEEELEELATVALGVDGQVLIGEGERAIAEVETKLEPNTVYTALRFREEVTDPETGDFVGYLYSYVGNVKAEKVGSEGENAIINVISLHTGLMKGDILVPFRSTQRTTPADLSLASFSQADASIVGFGESNQSIGGAGDFVFISKGTKGGVVNGAYYQVFSEYGFFVGDYDLENLKQPVATVKIIDTTDVGAVGYIVKQAKEVRLGNSVGKG